ncbi:MAG TPA: acyltransferase family protein [Verrucomicrobiae bacterium]|nr:acyltransferase family protein [Verrucomicrobiae bacterium]
MTTGHSIKYRPDIDGLRALAILPVVLYHAKLGCPGGFVGVDVFFVISGFLISSLIRQEMAVGTFSLVNFWERRIRRILPAMTAMVLATLIAAFFLFLPEDFAYVGKSVAATAVLGANFFFWKQSGYFAPGAETKPLLHTWSLAVEEQFYILFPLLLILLVRFPKKTLLAGMTALALVSFILSVIGTHTVNNLNSTFYLLPTRAWELMAGAVLAVAEGSISVTRPVREFSGWLGIVLIGWPVFFYSTATRFPGLAAVPPCLGAVLIIFSSESKPSSIGRGLAFPPLVFTGLISYSLYLWHWPLLMFTEYLSKHPPKNVVHLGLVTVSFLLAFLSWQFIEKPFRQRRILQRQPFIFGFAAISLVCLLTLGLVVKYQKGFAARFPATVMTYALARNHTPYVGYTDMGGTWAKHLIIFSLTKTNQPVDVLIWGDSHATALAPMIDTLCQQQSWLAMEATGGGVPPVLGSYRIKDAPEMSAEFSAEVIKYIAQAHPRKVVLAAKWSGYTASDSFKSNLLATVRAVLALGIPAYVVKDVPIPGYNVPRFAALAAMHHDDANLQGVTPEKYQKNNREMEATFDQIAQLGATVLDPAPYFLNSDGHYAVEKDDKVLYFDGDHLTVDGAMMLAPLFAPMFQTE